VVRTLRAVLMLVAAGGVLAVGTPVGAGTNLYRYVDDRGVVHFTNAPSDRRYNRINALRSLATRPGADHVSRVSAYHLSPVRSYDALIKSASRRHGVPAAMVKAVIHAESAFNPRAISPKGAMGLMQLMPGTAQLMGVEQPFHARQNVHGGTRYLRSLHDRYGNWTHTLAAYNAGPSAVDHYRGIPPYDETRQYVKRVLSYYRRYHGDFPR
jgi:soluble lytic murein transglycosylase-like protein